MKVYMYEPMWTQELEDKIVALPVLPLVEEMFYKYGLKVLDTKQVHTLFLKEDAVYLTLDGLTYCSVSVDSDGVWSYYSRNFIKQRGRTDDDRRTVTSKKLSSLMKSLEKYNAVPSSPTDLIKTNISGNIKSMIERTISGRSKNLWDASADDIHEILKVVFEDKNKSSLDEKTLTSCKNLLDSFNLSDDNVRQRKELVDSFFSESVYMIGQDTLPGHIVTKIGLSENNMVIEEPFIRVRSLSDHQDYSKMVAATTIMRLHLESLEKDFSFVRKDDPEMLIPITDKYFTNIGACAVYDRHPTAFDPCWLAFNA
jgi:hypothetical protein